MAYLVITEEGSERAVPLAAPETVVGRSRQNAVQLRTRQSSRHHCKIVPDADGWKMIDLGSSNGTYVNGTRLTEKRLADGDLITVGHAAIVYHDGEPGPTPTPPDAQTERVPIRDRNVEILLKTVLAASSRRNLGEFLRLAVDSTVEIAAADRGILYVVDAGGELKAEVARDRRRQDLPPAEDVSRSIPQRVLKEGRALYLLDGGAERGEQAVESKSAQLHRLKTVMCAPLKVGGRTLGVLYVDSRADTRAYDANDLALFGAVAGYVALSLENVRAAEVEKSAAEEARRRLESENARLRGALERRRHFIGECDAMKTVYARLKKVAPTDATVLLLGESGTGKEAMAHIVHDLSARSERAFVVIDCAAIPETLLESELFGYEKGAFTGAVQQKIGKFELGDGGTVFLDEIAELPLSMQVKLLRVIEQKEITRVGGVRPIAVNVRIVAATNRNLEEEVAHARFRQDLYFRLKVITVNLPPLRERGEDVLLLADAFLKQACAEHGRKLEGFTRDAREAMLRHRWEGNVREMQHRIEQAVILTDDPRLSAEHLQLHRPADQPFKPLEHARDQFERQYVVRALGQNGWNVSRTARVLGFSRQHLQNLMKKHQLSRPERGGTQALLSGD
jgi:transcriptional regulator with GAF, ATPase, and Fis domain